MTGNDHVSRELFQFLNRLRPVLYICVGRISKLRQTNHHTVSKEQFTRRKIDSHFILRLGWTGVKDRHVLSPECQFKSRVDREGLNRESISHFKLCLVSGGLAVARGTSIPASTSVPSAISTNSALADVG